MKDFSVEKARTSLTAKGFTEKKKGDHYRLFFWNDGKKTRIHTKISHGRRIHFKDLNNIRKQVRLPDLDGLERLLDCRMKEDEYAVILREQNLIK